MDFPNESVMPRSADGSEPIRSGSVGINRILGLFKDLSEKDREAHWQLYVLNAFSIFRNIFNATLTPPQLREAFLTDCEMFTVYLEAYLSHLPTRLTQPVPLVIYFPDYGKIPQNIRREQSEKHQEIDAKYHQLQKTFPRGPTQTSVGDYTTRWVVPVGRQLIPHFELARWIQGYAMENQTTAYRWGKPVFLFTHCPIDLHIHRRVPNISLVESYTAAIKLPIQFGTKLVKDKDVSIPFNTATHRAFGDDVHIAPIATHKVRKSLLELAVKNKWMQQSNEKVTSDISSTTQTPASELNRVKF